MGVLSTVTRGSSRCHPRGLRNDRMGTLSVRVRREEDIPDNQDCRFFGELVLLAASLEVDLATNSIVHVDLTCNQVGEGGGGGVWK